MAPGEEAMKQGSKLKRSRLVRRPAGAAALFVLLLLPLSPPARANSSNPLPNGSFQSGTIGTVSGSTTSFADSSVAPASTHAYTVAAFNYSPQSAPSNAVTTPQLQSSAVGIWHLDELS